MFIEFHQTVKEFCRYDGRLHVGDECRVESGGVYIYAVVQIIIKTVLGGAGE